MKTRFWTEGRTSSKYMQCCMQNHFDTLFKIIFMLLSSTLWENIFAFNLWNDVALILIFKKSKIK